jgi:predicted oxidoreductase
MTNSIKNFKIPEKFVLFGHTYIVKFEDDLYERESCFGLADEDFKTIRLQSKIRIKSKREIHENEKKKYVYIHFDITDEMIVETFYHELVHIILDSVGHAKLSKNEILVNIMAKAFLEIYLNSEYAD